MTLTGFTLIEPSPPVRLVANVHNVNVEDDYVFVSLIPY